MTARLGPGSGTIEVRTYREGAARAVGHDLVIEVGSWEATLELAEDGAPTAVRLEVDPRSLRVREGVRGAKPLTDGDRVEIQKQIDEEILRGLPILFAGRDDSGDRVAGIGPADPNAGDRFRPAPNAGDRRGGGRLELSGELTLAGTTRPARFALDLSPDGRLSGTLPLRQSEWGITPYRAFMGALRVRDAVEVALDVRLPSRA